MLVPDLLAHVNDLVLRLLLPLRLVGADRGGEALNDVPDLRFGLHQPLEYLLFVLLLTNHELVQCGGIVTQVLTHDFPGVVCNAKGLILFNHRLAVRIPQNKHLNVLLKSKEGPDGAHLLLTGSLVSDVTHVAHIDNFWLGTQPLSKCVEVHGRYL